MSTSRKPLKPDVFPVNAEGKKTKSRTACLRQPQDPVCTSGPTLRPMGSRLGHHRPVLWQLSVTRTLAALAFSLCGVAPCKNDAA
jgi:hypothetical protein